MADTRYVEQTVFDLKRALDDAVRLGLLPHAAARAVLSVVRVRMAKHTMDTQEVEHGQATCHTALRETSLRLRDRDLSLS